MRCRERDCHTEVAIAMPRPQAPWSLACVLQRSILLTSRIAVSTCRGRPRQGEQPMHRPCQGVSTRRDVMLPIASVAPPGVPDVAIGGTLNKLPRAQGRGSGSKFDAMQLIDLSTTAPVV